MGSSDVEKSSKDKESKMVAAATQEQSSATSTGPVNPEWPVYQAYSPMPAHSYLASSPQAHPYMWGVQHIVPPYGAPPPYVAMYPHHGGIYAHPSMPPGSYPFSPFAMPSPNGIAEASGNTPGAAEADGKSSEGKEKLPIKRSKGNLGSLNMITGKNSGAVKASAASANGGYSKSGESGSEGSSEGSDANSQNDSQMKSGDRLDSLEAETSQNGSSLHSSQNGGSGTPKIVASQTTALGPVASGAPSVPGPATNLNIGIEYWGTPSTTSIPVLRGSISSAPVAGANVAAGARDVQPQLWLQDERELKRQRRKQSNRESARRSRLRKQAECDELAQRAEVLKDENAALRAEVNRVRAAYEQLAAENASLKERLGDIPGNDETRSSRDKEPTGKVTQ